MIKSTADLPCVCNKLIARKRDLEKALADSGITAAKRAKLEVILRDVNRDIHAAGCAVVPELPTHIEVGAEQKVVRHKFLLRASSHCPSLERSKRKLQKTVRGRGRDHDFGFYVEPVTTPSEAELAKAARIEEHAARRRASRRDATIVAELTEQYGEWTNGVPYPSGNGDLQLATVGANDDDELTDPRFDLGWGG